MIAELSSSLERQLNHLVAELTERIPARLGTEQTQAAYSEAVERQRAIQRRIHYLQKVSRGLGQIAPETLVRGRVGFGSQVRVEDLQSGELSTFVIMAGNDLDFDAGEVSIASPVAQALLGHTEGEVVEAETPQRMRRFRILSTTTLFDLLGLTESATTPPTRCA